MSVFHFAPQHRVLFFGVDVCEQSAAQPFKDHSGLV